MGDDVTVYPFARGAPPQRGRAVAWWNDGSVAAAEQPAGTGCVRDVGVGVPAAGDLVLRASFRRIVAGLFAPCGGARSARPLDDSLVAVLRGDARRAAARDWAESGDRVPPLARWLLAGAALLIAGEPLLRRRSA